MYQVCVGRQPLFDRALATVGYELLFRADANASAADFVDGDTATAQVLIGAFGAIGIDHLVGEKTAFVNLTAHYVLNPELVDGLPIDRVVLEIVESTEATDAVVDGVRRLSASGYRIALDDFDPGVASAPLLDFAHIVKYDFREVNGTELAHRIILDHDAGRIVVVERIETTEDYAAAAAAGADYFQGYFFARPAVVTAATIPPNVLALVRLLDQINRPSATIDEIVDVLSQDVAMSVMVLRFINSAASGLKREINSIGHAAMLIGRDLLRSWCALALLSSVDGKPLELVTLALTRAKFCELEAERRGLDDAAACYTVGMLSLLDAMTDTSMEVITRELAVNDDIRSALLREPGPMTEVLTLVEMFERPPSEPDDIRLDRDAGADPVIDAYRSAMTWATRLVAPL